MLAINGKVTQRTTSIKFLDILSMNIIDGKTIFQLLKMRFQKILEFYIKPTIFWKIAKVVLKTISFFRT